MIHSNVQEAVAFVRANGIEGTFDAAIVLGTGLGTLVDELDEAVSLAYADIPHFPRSGVSGHAGRLVAGLLEGRRVLLFQGRAHYYETGDAGAMRVPVALVKELGIPTLVLTNAAGSVRAQIRPGSLVAINDHLNLSGANPLLRDHTESRFVSLTGAYDEGLRAALRRAADKTGIALPEGVYAWLSGPSFETPAEIRMVQTLGGDLVGMSTVPEVILARYYGLKVAAVSVVTNLAAGIEGASPSHQETKDTAAEAADRFKRLVRAFVAELSDV
ncbi:purine-nucleoside phosphorylase [Microvirga sp. 17 mud 1-3]|uniref:purine-nucleoside phosphorylase n=1 Tax=Microvirga sp. 17 mud 1-3 TaxID=2082949 RepID=UPI000D6D2D06|nr:purine-nucleoside phosphorylase [Microvirga sp. 17 mud 1-3]AWM88012.1 purine-nucleoside phosphorylase [Microvirga sp. 17 mud 1-3]